VIFFRLDLRMLHTPVIYNNYKALKPTNKTR